MSNAGHYKVMVAHTIQKKKKHKAVISPLQATLWGLCTCTDAIYAINIHSSCLVGCRHTVWNGSSNKKILYARTSLSFQVFQSNQNIRILILQASKQLACFVKRFEIYDHNYQNPAKILLFNSFRGHNLQTSGAHYQVDEECNDHNGSPHQNSGTKLEEGI